MIVCVGKTLRAVSREIPLMNFVDTSSSTHSINSQLIILSSVMMICIICECIFFTAQSVYKPTLSVCHTVSCLIPCSSSIELGDDILTHNVSVMWFNRFFLRGSQSTK